MHPAAANRFDDPERLFAIVEHIEDWRHLAHVLREGAIPDEVVDDAEQLRQHYPNHFCARWNYDPGKLFEGGEIRKVIHHAAEVINAICVGDVGVPGLALCHLLRATMVKADIGYGVNYLFAIQFQHDAKNAMGSGML